MTFRIHTHIHLGDAWEENKHKRDQGGRFSSTGVGGHRGGPTQRPSPLAMKEKAKKTAAKALDPLKEKRKALKEAERDYVTAATLFAGSDKPQMRRLVEEAKSKRDAIEQELQQEKAKKTTAPKAEKKPKAEKAPVDISSHVEKLRQTISDPGAFSKALEGLKSIKKAELDEIAKQFTGGKNKYKNKSEALKDIELRHGAHQAAGRRLKAAEEIF